MDMSQMISDAWALTRRHRSLWLLALFAGLPVSSCSGGSPRGFNGFNRHQLQSSGDVDTSGVDDALTNGRDWLGDHAPLVATIILLVLAAGLFLFCISIIAQGGMSRASLELASGRQITLGRAWGAGVGSFWRYLRLILLSIVIFAPISILLLGISLIAVRGGSAGAFAALSGLAVLLTVLIGVPFQIVFTFARLAIVTEDTGAAGGLRAGWRLFRARLGSSLLLWLVSLALPAAVAVAAMIALILIAIPLALLGVVLALTVGGGLFVAYLLLVGVAAGAALLVLVAAGSAFAWHLWTLGYLRLRSQAAALT